MSARHFLAALLISCSALLLAKVTRADEGSIDLNTTGKAEASDVGYAINPNPDHGNNQNGDSCPDCGCGDCNCCGENFCVPYWRWIGAVEATYLYVTQRQDPSSPLGWSPAPRIWLGVENCDGCGARVRYWQLRDNLGFV